MCFKLTRSYLNQKIVSSLIWFYWEYFKDLSFLPTNVKNFQIFAQLLVFDQMSHKPRHENPCKHTSHACRQFPRRLWESFLRTMSDTHYLLNWVLYFRWMIWTIFSLSLLCSQNGTGEAKPMVNGASQLELKLA